MNNFFASNCTVCPILRYSGDVCDITLPPVDRSLISEAEKVLVLGLAGGLDSHRDRATVSGFELRNRVIAYIDSLALADQVNVEKSTSAVTLATVVKPGGGAAHNAKHTVYLTGSPVAASAVAGICAHEVGTHLLRMMNNDHQVWSRGQRSAFKLTSHVNTEEGLATLNALSVAMSMSRGHDELLLWSAALRYYAATVGESSDFVSLFTAMAKYIPEPDTRFRFCCRVKRGLVDTSLPGACAMDQSYFIGAVDLLRNLRHTDFVALYCGLVDRGDLCRVANFARVDCLRLPLFLRSEEAVIAYTARLEMIAAVNQIQAPSLTSVPRSLSRGIKLVRRLSRGRDDCKVCPKYRRPRSLSLAVSRASSVCAR